MKRQRTPAAAIALLMCLLPMGALKAAETTATAKRNQETTVMITAEDLKSSIPQELRVTNPDYVVYVPKVTSEKVNDTGNEHFHVFDGPDGSLMAVWTQSTAEGKPDQHIVFSRSEDEGKTWSEPRLIAGARKPGEGHIASWQLPMVSKSGRIYVLYSQHVGKFDTFYHTTGRMDGIWSDDNGKTWSEPQTVAMARSNRDNPDESYPANWIAWQRPLRLTRDGKYLAGFTRWTSTAVKTNPTKSWISHDSRVEFMRFENLDDNPQVRDLKIAWIMQNDAALAVAYAGFPETSVCQEPAIVKLPDGRLFCVMRTASGSPYWSVGDENGENWTTPSRLLRKDGGEPLLHPLSPSPIYDVGGNTSGSGRYALFIHNHDGHYKGYGPTDTSMNRRPIYLVAGHFQPQAKQPVWFDEPRLFMDHKGVGLGAPGTKGRVDLAMYSSFTVRNGKAVLWYPDRKFFLLGRVIGKKWLQPIDDVSSSPASAASTSAAKPDPKTDWKRSKPDVVVYVPKGEGNSDTDNEHFLVFPSPAGDELLAVWNQSSCEGRGDNHVVLARSRDGVKWSDPMFVCGTHTGTSETQASWPFPVVAKTGRIYIFYTKQGKLNDGNPQGCGTMGCCTSDDVGRTWTQGPDIPMPRNQFDNPDPQVPSNWIVWQVPIRDRHGRVFAGYTQMTSRAVQPREVAKYWYKWVGRCMFMRFDNILEGPPPEKLKITWLPDDPTNVEVTHPNTGLPHCSEPSIVLLPDGRLFSTMRTWTGHIWYTVSEDDGHTWRKPEVLRYRDGGEPVKHPLAPCPIYKLQDGRYLLLYHNNDGKLGEYDQLQKDWKTNQLCYIRHPAFIAVGEFRPKAHQPIWFSQPKQILDTDGIVLGPKGTSEIATYTSLTEWKGKRVLWYPDRKFYLLGKYLPDELLADMKAPE